MMMNRLNASCCAVAIAALLCAARTGGAACADSLSNCATSVPAYLAAGLTCQSPLPGGGGITIGIAPPSRAVRLATRRVGTLKWPSCAQASSALLPVGTALCRGPSIHPPTRVRARPGMPTAFACTTSSDRIRWTATCTRTETATSTATNALVILATVSTPARILL